MQALQAFARDQPTVARAAEALRDILEPLRDRNDRWTTDPDGRSRPGVAVDRARLRDDVRGRMGKSYSEAAFRQALDLCTVNTTARTTWHPVWQALQDLVPAYYRHSERAHAIRHYYDLLLLTRQDSLRTAVTDCDPQFALHCNPSSGAVRLGRLIDWRSRVDHHYYLLAVYGAEPEYIELGNGEFLYFDDPDIR